MAIVDFATTERPQRQVPAAPRPSTEPLGIVAQWRAARDNPITIFPQAAYEAPIFVVRRAGRTLAVVNDPAAIERVLVTNAANYAKSPQQQRRIQPALREGLLTAEGEVWRSGRRIAAPLFSPKAITLLREDMRVAAEAMVQRWKSLARSDAPLDLAEEFQRLTYDIVSRTVFSGALDDDRITVRAAMAEYFETIGRVDLASFFSLPGWVPTLGNLRARSTTAVFRGVVTGAVRERTAARARGEAPPGDLLDRLMDAKDGVTGQTMSPEIVLDNVLTFLAAGHETTGNALAWIGYLLATFPDTAEQLLAEHEAVLGTRPIGDDDLGALPFTGAVIDEALRLYPPAPFLGRQAMAADELSGVAIPAGAQVLTSPWLVHRHRKLWDDPEQFLPERFSAENRKRIPRGAYIPFGLGPRVCIGQAFALQEMKIVLAAIVRQFRFELPAGTNVMPQARITLYPRGGLPMWVWGR